MGLAIFSVQTVNAQKESSETTSSGSMKQSTFPILLVNYDSNSFNQVSNKNQETREFYLNKSQHQNTAAWVLLGAGSTMAIVGMIGAMRSTGEMMGSILDWDSQNFNKASANTGTYAAIMLTGLAADVVSIPFFISASHNKKKSASISLGNQTIYTPLDKSYRNVVPSLTLRIRL